MRRFLLLAVCVCSFVAGDAHEAPAQNRGSRRSYPSQRYRQPAPHNQRTQQYAPQRQAQLPADAQRRPGPPQNVVPPPAEVTPQQMTGVPAEPTQPEASAEATTEPSPDEPANNLQPTLTMEAVLAEKQSALQAAGEDTQLIEALSSEYQTAVAQLNGAEEFRKKTADFGALQAKLPRDAADVRRDLDAIMEAELSPNDAAPLPTTLGALEAERVARQDRARTTSAALDETNTKIESALGDRANATTRLSELEGNWRDVEELLAAPAVADESPLVTQARRTKLQTSQLLIAAEQAAMKAQIAFVDARSESNILVWKRDLYTQQLQQAQAAVHEVEAAEQRKRDQIDEAALQAARRAEAQADPNILALAKANTELLESKKSVADQIRGVQTEHDRISRLLDEIKLRFKIAEEREKRVGSPPSVGAALRKHRMDLPNTRREQQIITSRQQRIVEAQLKISDSDEERKRLADIRREAERYVASLPNADQQAEAYRKQLVSDATIRLTERRQILDELRQQQNALFNALTEADVDHRDLIKETNAFAEYIDQRVLWIRSAEPMSFDLRSDQGFRWAAAEPWLSIGRQLRLDLQQHWPRYAAAILIFFILSFAAGRSARVLSTLAEESKRSTCRRFLPTARAFFLASVTALRNVFPLIFIAWRLRSVTAEDNSLALATALSVATRVALPLEFFRQVLRRDGLAEAHFSWSERTILLLRRHLRWLSPVATILVATAVLLASDDGARGPTNIERVLFVAASALVCLFAYRVAHPKRGVPAQFLAEYPDGWISRLTPCWFALLVVAPMCIAVLSALGYVYTANELAWRTFATVTVLAATAVVFSLAARALLVSRRAAYIDQARQRHRAEAESAPKSGDEAVADQLLAEVQHQDPLADLRAQTVQARRLMAALFVGAGAVAVWFTWRDVLPAVSERGALWYSAEGDVVDPVTLFEVVVAILTFGLSLIAARDLPGLAEIAVLNRLPIDRSVRYAITTLVSYGIVLAGLIVACNLIGLRWSQIQWMATALTLGLGFGLQEMFANFVAGIIILFERPVRVGDIVTLGEVTGVVSRVRIRATTITNWDRKDYIVPNKDFITGRVLNWTLSDHVNRILINVGIAYGSDTQLAKQLIYGIAKNHELVVDDPEPMVTFEAFGASSLDFALRCYISMNDMPMRLQVIDELHTAIDGEFRKAGIEIAFPQQDLHIRDMPKNFLPQPRAPEELSD